jgi:hypothetical protein
MARRAHVWDCRIDSCRSRGRDSAARISRRAQGDWQKGPGVRRLSEYQRPPTPDLHGLTSRAISLTSNYYSTLRQPIHDHPPFERQHL